MRDGCGVTDDAWLAGIAIADRITGRLVVDTGR
jgi:hypothetical protein